MRIYRIEDENGDGPYNGGREITETLFWAHVRDDGNAADVDETHPQPSLDIAGFTERLKGRYRFAFDSMEQLLKWFGPNARRVLKRYPFTVAEYSVPEPAVIKGIYQVAYDPERAEPIARTPVGEIK